MVLIALLVAALLVSVLLGRLARMSVRELTLQTVAMAAAVLAFYGLVILL